MTIGPLGIGDVIAVEITGLADDLIRVGDDIKGKPTPASHVVVVHHQDSAGRWWGIQGQPGTVGWVDMAEYWGSPTAKAGNSNGLQPRTPAQRQSVADLCAGLVGIGRYDWLGGIVPDGLDDVHLPELADLVDKWWGWQSTPGKPEALAPGHVVCSSMPAWAHDRLGIPRPMPKNNAEAIQPADWWVFNNEEQWK
jgi:hypothetical protein